MLTADEIQNLAIAKSKGKRPKYLGDEAADHLLSMVMVLAEEVAVSRERSDTLERLLEKHGVLNRSEIETYIPDTATGQARQSQHSDFIARLMRSLRHEVDALRGDNRSTDELHEFLKEN